jgi:hypothetical protein
VEVVTDALPVFEQVAESLTLQRYFGPETLSKSGNANAHRSESSQSSPSVAARRFCRAALPIRDLPGGLQEATLALRS